MGEAAEILGPGRSRSQARSEPLALLGNALAGRRIGLVSVDEGPAYSDGQSIFLPQPGAERRSLTLIAQAAMIAAGSLDPAIVARTAGRRSLRSRYVTLEAVRASRRMASVLPRAFLTECELLYDGPVGNSPRGSFELAGSSHDVPEAPEWLGTIRPSAVIRGAMAGGGELTGKDLAQAADLEIEDEPQDDDEEGERSKILELLSSPLGSASISKALRNLLGSKSSGESDGAAGSQISVGRRQIGRVGRHAEQVEHGVEMEIGPLGIPVGRIYPEWNQRNRNYRDDWCSVTEYDPRPPEDERELDPGHDLRLRRELAKLGISLERRLRQDDGDVLDPAALVEFVVDRTIGAHPDPRIYEQRRPTGHDLGVFVLLDASGSTEESDASGSVFDGQRALAARIVSNFDALGDRVACYAFQSWGRHHVNMLRVKDFDARYDHAAQFRLASLDPTGFTRLGAAIRHGTHLLGHKGGTGNSLLIAVGDGLPYDDGYERTYAQMDTRRALQEAVAAGVACACISVKTSTDADVIERTWGGVPHVQIEDPSELGQHVTPLLRTALAEAKASRRRLGALLDDLPIPA